MICAPTEKQLQLHARTEILDSTQCTRKKYIPGHVQSMA